MVVTFVQISFGFSGAQVRFLHLLNILYEDISLNMIAAKFKYCFF